MPKIWLCHSGNYLLHRLGKRRSAEHLRAWVRQAKERGITVVLLGSPEPSLTIMPPAFYAKNRAPGAHCLRRQGQRPRTERHALKSEPIPPDTDG